MKQAKVKKERKNAGQQEENLTTLILCITGNLLIRKGCVRPILLSPKVPPTTKELLKTINIEIIDMHTEKQSKRQERDFEWKEIIAMCWVLAIILALDQYAFSTQGGGQQSPS